MSSKNGVNHVKASAVITNSISHSKNMGSICHELLVAERVIQLEEINGTKVNEAERSELQVILSEELEIMPKRVIQLFSDDVELGIASFAKDKDLMDLK